MFHDTSTCLYNVALLAKLTLYDNRQINFMLLYSTLP